MKIILTLLTALLLAPLAALLVYVPPCQAALLTSFTDDFNRAEMGPNYAAARGAAFVIRESQVLTNGGAGQDQTYLTLGTLPTAEDNANGLMFTASIDLFIPADGQASVVTAGLVLNEQDLKGGTANRVIRFRGHGASSCAIQLGGGLGGESVNMGTLSNNTWHTLTVSSTEPGEYRYAFSERGSPKQILSGRFVQTAPHILTGGHIGFYTENAAAGAYQFDNFSVNVGKRAAVAGNELLLFSDQQDITNTWGKFHFGTSSLQHLRSCENPGFELSLCLPRNDGAWDVYGRTFTHIPHDDQVKEMNSWKLIRATTMDGARFENVETVYESTPGPWTFNHAMAYNPETKEFMLLMLKMENFGFGYTAFFSPDGRNWKEHPKNPLYYDGDAISLFWSPVAKRFICVAKSFQMPFSKHTPDHGGIMRRVLSIRSSRDGRTWEPSESVSDIWNRGGKQEGLPVELLTLPDEQDPPDLEFYSGNGFSHHDRCYLMVLNYAGTPLHPGKHGPQLDTEWWVGRDGLHWERPGRDVNALGDAFPGNARITHNPMIIGGQFLFHFGNHLVGMKQDRISYVGARANAEFSTTLFAMPQGDLLLNAAVPSPERAFAAQQAYVRVAVLDEKGAVVPGFEAEKCLIQNDDDIDLPLLWAGRSARELAGQKIRLRFQLRSANIYAVTFRK